ncbi:murein biosynthesis integral membrane protein MurJ [Cellvibrio sp. ARAG 10.3]|uniref:murein biosynthesis integral membrane protein MurJ n=1 Tax=Cellvibrio sp. ARAG 10.3 TaxID=3451358 RepID=UPI003F490308
MLRSSVVTGSMTMMSRVLGLVRDQVLAHVLGAGGAADAFFLAFKIPNFFRRLFSEGAFSQAFVPVLSEYRQNGPHAAVQALVDRVAGCLGSVLLLVTVLAVIGSPVVAAIFASGYLNDPLKFTLLSDLIRITFPYLLLISLTGFAGAVLNSYDRFAVPAFTPVLLNICMIGAAWFAAPWFSQPVFALAWGVLVAGILSLLFQLPFLRRIHLLPVPRLDWQDPGVKRILTLMVPALFGVSVSQINLMLDSILASFLPDGSVGWLFYSDRLVELPLGVFAIAVATVIMPNLSRQHAAQSGEHFNRTLDWAIRMIVLIALPSLLALVILAQPILFTLFHHGQMTVRDILMSSYSLQAYALGLLGFMLIKVLAPGYFARQDMKTPVRIGIIAVFANIGMKALFVAPLYFLFNLGHVGLALATALAAYVNAGLLYRGLRRSGVYQPERGWGRLMMRYGTANLMMVLALLGLLQVWSDWATWDWLQRAMRLGALCGAGFMVYVITLAVVGVRLKDFRNL